MAETALDEYDRLPVGDMKRWGKYAKEIRGGVVVRLTVIAPIGVLTPPPFNGPWRRAGTVYGGTSQARATWSINFRMGNG